MERERYALPRSLATAERGGWPSLLTNRFLLSTAAFSWRCSATVIVCVFILVLESISASQEPATVLYRPSVVAELPADAKLISGNWSASDGTIAQNDATQTGLALMYQPQWKRPYTATVRVRILHPETGAEAGLALNLRDAKNFVVCSFSLKKGGSYAVLRIQVDPGSGMVGDEVALVTDLREWHELSVDTFGANLRAYVDGKPVVAYSFLGVSSPAHTDDGISWPEDPSSGAVGLYTTHTGAEFSGFVMSRKSRYDDIITPQVPLRDAQGRLLARQSYAETMRRVTEWMINSPATVDVSTAPPALRTLPPYLLTSWVDSDDTANMGAFIQEFAINHSMLISGAVRYYVFSGDRRALELAQRVADWHLANRTPADWALPHLPPSTVNWQPDGTWQGQDWGLEPDKSAYMGMSLLKLSAATGEQKYKTAALQIAATVRKLQRSDGSWPFRVDPKTGEVKYGYTESALWYAEFYDLVASMTGNADYKAAARTSLRWLLENPVKTNDWRSFYGDVKTGLQSYDQWVPLETAMYLLDHRQADPTYLASAKSILDWVNRTLIMNPGLAPGTPGLMEQTAYRVVLTHHELRLADVYAKLWHATGNVNDRDLAIQIANSVTWCLMSDGKMRLGLGRNAYRIGLVLIFNDQFADIMAMIPETAPTGESHLLSYTSDIQNIAYKSDQINYSTAEFSDDLAIAALPPTMVTWEGKRLPRQQHLEKTGWAYDSSTHVIHIRHEKGQVVIHLRNN
ncbi:MAG TPA: hypothetical protein VOA41_01865 [Candidatus Dormibacteraeota bacterium]|nr:hypothetical protein [Candidatus Dormibacteraeota bacterium]